MYFAGAVPYLRLKRESGALPYFTGAQLYLSGAETVEYSLKRGWWFCFFDLLAVNYLQI